MKRLASLLFLGMSLIVGCQQQPAQSPEPTKPEVKTGGVYRAALPWRPATLDPAFSTDIYAVTVIQQLFDGLVQFDQDLNLVPALAATWKVSADGLTYTFKLRRDAKFHNGRTVTADDFVYSFTRMLDRQEGGSSLSFLKKIRGALAYGSGRSPTVRGLKALDPGTLEITLKEPFAPFLSVLAMSDCRVVPGEEVQRWGKEFGLHPVGTGPFRLESWTVDEINLTANTEHYEGRPNLDRVVYRIYAGAQNEKILEDFQAGRLEEAAVFGAGREKMVQTRSYQFYRKPTLSLLFYGINCESGPLSDRSVRQALNQAINKPAIIYKYVKDQFVPASTVLPPGMPGYTPKNAAYSYDPDRAKGLLAEAGYTAAQEKLSLTLLSASKSRLAQEELALVAADLAAVGIELRVQYETDWPSFEALLKAGKFQLYRYAWSADIPDPDNFLTILCSSESSYNFMRYRNPEVDALLSRALVETDMLERVALYRQAEQIILDDAPMIPWLYMTFEAVFQPYVKGLEISALGSPYIPLKKVWLDEN